MTVMKTPASLHNRKGFTLVEIMIVVVIIGLLAAMAIPAFQKVRETSRQKAMVNNLRQVASAGQQYILDKGVSTVSYSLLVKNGYFNTIQTVGGENYVTLGIGETGGKINVRGGQPPATFTY